MPEPTEPQLTIDPVAPTEPVEPVAPEPTVEELQAKLAAEAEARAAAEAQTETLNTAYQNLAQAALTNAVPTTQVVAPPEPSLPNQDEDPEAYQQALIAKQIKEGIEAAVGPLASTAAHDRQLLLANAIEQQRITMKADPVTYPGYAEIEDEINTLTRGVSLDQLAQPGALGHLYYNVMGRKAAKEAASPTSTPSMGTTGRSTVTTEPSTAEAPPTLSAAEARFASRGAVEPKDFRALQGGGRMGIDEFRAMKPKGKPA